MSDPQPISSQSEEATPQCSCEDCTGDVALEPAPTNTPPTKTKRYIPPAADINTFESQQAFLESLSPIAIEEIDVEKRKCPICWKPFGERADAGYDNSEQPVKLQCGHAFGDKCLTHTYAVPQPSTVDLEPLSFRLHSNSRALAQKLQAFVQENSGIFENEADMFIKMLEDSRQAEVGHQRFGIYWWRIIYWLLESSWDVADINFFENAVILDTKPPPSKKKSLYMNPYSTSTYVPPGSAFSEPQTGASTSSLSLSAVSALPSVTLPQLQEEPSNTVPKATNMLLQPVLPLTIISSSPDISKVTAPLISEYEAPKLSFYDDKVKKREAELERLRGLVARLLAKKLAAIHGAYQASHESSKQHEELERKNYPRIISSAVLLHTDDFQALSNEIRAPIQSLFAENGDSEEESMWEHFMFIVTRSLCKSCRPVGKQDTAELAIPKSLWWKDDREVPDGCPLCHRVLFEKKSEDRSCRGG